MEEEKDIIEENNTIEESDDIVSEDNTDEDVDVVEESDEEENDESEEDEFDETRKIDFANKNEVYQDFFDEKKKSKFSVVLLVIFVLVLIGVGCYFVYIYRDKIFNKFGNVVDNMDALVDVNKDDDNDKENISTSSDDVEEKILNVYQKGSDSIVVFTYKCKSSDCDIEVTKDSFILYDEDKVYYRDMTAYELEQINNTEKTPVKSELSFNGFVEVKSIYDDPEFVDEEKSIFISSLGKLYIIDNELYKFGDIEDNIEKFVLIDDEVLFCRAELGILYNYKEKKIISWGEQGYVDYKKVNDFYLILYIEGDGRKLYQAYNNFESIVMFSLSNGYYINDNKLYYLDYKDDNKIVQIVNNKKESFDYNNDGINPIHIFDGKLMYTDDNDVLCIKNILTNEIIYKSEIKLKNWEIFEYEDGFKIFESDHDVINNEDFEKYRKEQNITDELYDNVKKCINSDKDNNSDEYVHPYCEFYWFGVGYMISLDEDGKFISKEYYIEVNE